MARIIGAEVTVEQLKREGVDTLYVLRGDPSHIICDYAARTGMRVITVAHEQTAAMAASAHSYLKRTCAVAIVGSGPAHTNAITGVANSWANCWPMLLISGASERRMRNMGDFQESPQVEAAAPFCKSSRSVDEIDAIPREINLAIRTALSGRPGPTYLDLPSDLITGDVEESAISYVEPFGTPTRQVANVQAVEDAMGVLQRSERPLLIVGKGAAFSRAEEELREFVQRTNIPFLSTPMGAGVVDPLFPSNVASARTEALRGADTVLLVGARLNWILHFGLPPRFPSKYNLVQVDIDPDEIGVNVPADVGLVGDAKSVVAQLNSELERTPVHYGAESPWLMSLKEFAAKNAADIAPMLGSDAVPMGYYRILREIRDYLPKDSIVIADGANVMDISRQVINTHVPRHRLDAGVFGNVGIGFPFAIAAQETHPDKKVVILQGDWSIGFNGMEMETLARYSLPVVCVVFQNGNNLTWHRDYISGDSSPRDYQPGIRYDQVMIALGGSGETVQTPKELRGALERSFVSDGPYLINVLMDPAATRRPQEFFWLARQGSMRY